MQTKMQTCMSRAALSVIDLKLETTQMSINKWMDNQTVYIHITILLSNKNSELLIHVTRQIHLKIVIFKEKKEYIQHDSVYIKL